MMAVRVANDLLRRADKAGDFPNWHAVLKQPGNAGVFENVRRDIVAESGQRAGAVHGGVERVEDRDDFLPDYSNACSNTIVTQRHL